MSLPELTYKTDQTSIRLDGLVKTLMEQHIKPVQLRKDLVREAWLHMIPGGLAPHCWIKAVSGGELEVGVDSPVYLYELKVCAEELLKALQAQVPQAGLRKIKLSLRQSRGE